MDRLDVHLSGSFKGVMWLAGIFTLGVGALALWLQTRRWPRTLDAEGITLRNGQRLLWKDLTDLRRVTVTNRLGDPVTSRLDLFFGDKRVSVVPHSLAEGGAVVDFIHRVLGQATGTG